MNMKELVNQALTNYKQDLSNGLTEIADSDYIFFLCDEIGNNENMTDSEYKEFTELAYDKICSYKESLLPQRNQLMLERIRGDFKLNIISEGTYFELETILLTNSENMLDEIEQTTSPSHFEDLLVHTLKIMLNN